jgi:hypothetical protein
MPPSETFICAILKLKAIGIWLFFFYILWTMLDSSLLLIPRKVLGFRYGEEMVDINNIYIYLYKKF